MGLKVLLIISVFFCLGKFFIPAGAEIESERSEFYSSTGREHIVSYKAVIRTQMTSLEALYSMSDWQKRMLKELEIAPLQSYLFGPAIRRGFGSPQKLYQINVDWPSARLVDGQVEIDYQALALWILDKKVAKRGSFEMPVPLNQKTVFTDGWTKCSDHDPDHQTRDFLWYFWDPNRPNCDNQLNKQYQNVAFEVGIETENQKESRPEYDKILTSAGKNNNLQMTFAFGYVTTPKDPRPESDSDYGARQYQSFLRYVRSTYRNLNEEPILRNEYRGFKDDKVVMGHRFTGNRSGVRVTLNVLMAGKVDQMEVFAKSFAHDHDGFFAWFGHSRLGAGFDADQLRFKLLDHPNYYSITDRYQLVYWAGCNSYSYYTLPFFKFKAEVNPQDPNGTKGLDIIANGLPSLFALNDANARITLYALMNWQYEHTYQEIISALEKQVSRTRTKVLVAVLGDEDNE